jgi:serine protease Do
MTLSKYLTRCLGFVSFVSLLAGFATAQSREEKVLNDKLRFEKSGLWYYNDLEQGFEVAKKLNQPVLVVLRCIPCEECVKLDDDIMEANPRLQQLLKSFARVRIVGTNGLDLSLFEFDTDQSFAVFVFGPDRTLYGRYGTRSDRKAWEDDVSVDGLVASLEGALRIHREYPANREQLVGKQPKPPIFATPEQIPSLAAKYGNKLDYEGNVVKSCIHCHMIGDGMRDYYRSEQGRLPDHWLYPYPHPKTIGLILDPHQSTLVKQVIEGTPAALAGFKVGDQIATFQEQAILSIADVQWVLNSASNDGAAIPVKVDRNNATLEFTLKLEPAWKSREDIAWRSSSWPLRQRGLGGMVVKPATDEERASLGIPKDKMALVVQHVGMYAPHDRAKKAGMQKGDILLEYDGRTDLVRETDLLAYAINSVPVGKTVDLRIRRGAEEKTLHIATVK